MSDDAPPPASRADGLVSFRQYVWLWNRLQGLTTPDLHLEIAGWLEDAWRRGDERLLLMVFRDAGKSTLVGLFCTWLLSVDPNLRILVVAAEHGLATKMVRNVRGVLERHPLAKALLDPAPGSWASDQLTVRRPRELRDPSMLARGLGANLTGARADLVICDDVEVPNTADTAAKRDDLRRRLAELSFVLVPGGLQLCIGTPHARDTIYADPEGHEPENRPFLADYRRLVLPILDGQGHSRWPERFPRRKVQALEREVGPLRFRAQMMLEPVDLREVRLDPSRLEPFDGELEVTTANRRLRYTIEGRELSTVNCWWDPAFGSPSGGDASVVAVVFADHAGGFWCTDLVYLHHDPALAGEVDEATQLCRQVVAIARKNRCPAITLETNGIGRFLPNLLRQTVKRAGVPILIREHTATRNKDRRIVEAFDPVLAARSLHVHRRVLETPFVQEMRDFQPGAHNRDDGLDAVAACLVEQGTGLGAAGSARGGAQLRADFRP